MWPFNKNNKVKNKKRKYEGAAKGRRTSGWITGSGDANSEVQTSLPILRSRSRDLRRNNPYINRAISVISNNVVGKGIKTQIDNDEIQEIWREWTESNEIDYDGRNDLTGLQRMVIEAVAESGEVLVRRRIVSGAKYPIQYQILEGDFLDNTILNTSPSNDGNFVIQGVEFDGNGKRVGYHIYESHPGSIDHPFASLNSNFIPASEILHVYRADRPGQVRGVPWPAPVMIKTRDLDDFEDAQLMRQKIAACFTAFVHDISADVDCDEPEDDLGEKIQPGLIEQLPSGKTVTFANPPSVENYKEFTSSHLRAISTGMGITYESMANDLADVNFSAGRMGWIEMGRNVDAWTDGIMINQMMKPVTKDFIFMLTLMGKDVGGLKFVHVPPKREMIDPSKEIPAMASLVRNGFSSRSEVISSLGKNANDVTNQISKDNKKADELKLILDSDPRYTNSNGKLHEGDNGEQNNSNE